MNAQRKVIYTRRHHAVMGERIGLDIINTLYESVEDAARRFGRDDYEGFKMHVLTTFAIEPPFSEDEYRSMDEQEIIDQLYENVNKAFRRKTERLSEVAYPVISQLVEEQLAQGAPEPMGQIRVPIGDGRRLFGIVVDIKEAYETKCKSLATAWQKAVLLLTIDESWKVHLRELDQLRQSVQNASYEQKDPLVIYKIESFKLFETMLGDMNIKSMSTLMRGAIPVEATQPDDTASNEQEAQQPRRPASYDGHQGEDALEKAQRDNELASRSASAGTQQQRVASPVHSGPKIGRNDPCPCGSGKKYKNCHGKGVA